MFNLDTYAFNIADIFKPAGYFTNFGKLSTDIVTILVSAAGALAVIFIIISGIKLVTASGDSKKMAGATGTLTYSLIGLAVVVLAFIIIQVVEAFFKVNVVDIGVDTGGGNNPNTPTCALSTSLIAPGGVVTVISNGGLSGTIGMQGALGSPVYSALGTLPADGSTRITVPSGATNGLYVVRVGGYGVGCKPDLSVTATCALGSNTVIAGNNLGFGYSGFPAGQTIFIWDGASIRYNLGTTSIGPQLVSLVIPATAIPKNYTGFITNGTSPSVVCGTVTVTAANDADGDGFSDIVELFVGTNPNLACGVNAWPPDFNNDKAVNILDLQILAPHQTSLGKPYDKRYDLNMDGKINSTDQGIVGRLQGKTCI